MDNNKYDHLFDIIEHPDKYSREQLMEELSDPETREIYNLLCMTDSTVKANGEIDIEKEWTVFSRKDIFNKKGLFAGLGSRAATIGIIIGSSLLAVAAGIAVATAVVENNNSDTAFMKSATMTSTNNDEKKMIVLSESNDSVNQELVPFLFENESLEVIMQKIGSIYGVEVEFNNKESAELRLYYRFDPTLSLDEIVEQLNTFEQIKITQTENSLKVD